MYKRKKLLSYLLIFCCLLIVLPLSGVAVQEKNSDTHCISSHCPFNYLDLSISGDILDVSGVLSTGFSSMFWAIINVGENQTVVDIEPGEKFSARLSIKNLKNKTALELYTGHSRYGTYRGCTWHNIYIEPGKSGGYKFHISPVLGNNETKSGQWVNPSDGMKSDIPEEIKTLSDVIAKDAGTDYDKIFELYKWVVENICYDYDYYYGISENVITATEVLNKRRSVCQGISNLLQSLIQAQDIPCIIVSSFSLGLDTSGQWSDEYVDVDKPNHAYNEAFADGRWIVMDATWDCTNRYENGECFYEQPNCFLYFDITPEFMAGTHKIIYRSGSSEMDTPGSWAREETLSAIAGGIVPVELQNNYRAGITRAEFCKLILSMLCRKSSMNFDEYLQAENIKAGEGVFTDTSDKYVLAANVMGIVNGKGNGKFAPDSAITRQEAAKILAETAKAVGIKEPGGRPICFSDEYQFASWAVDSIKFITALSSRAGEPIMGGVGNNAFSPFGTYTREQAILTVYRLYSCL